MALLLYMDQHVPRAITTGLRLRGIDVLTAFEDDASKLDDSALLDRATQLGRVLFSQDDDLLVEATARQQAGISFAGGVYAHQLRVSVGRCIDDLTFLAAAGTAADVANQVIFLPI